MCWIFFQQNVECKDSDAEKSFCFDKSGAEPQEGDAGKAGSAAWSCLDGTDGMAGFLPNHKS